MRFFIRPYDPCYDLAEVHRLWREVFLETWPIEQEIFRQVTSEHSNYRPGDHFVAEMDGRIVGFVGSQVYRGPVTASPGGGISVLFVDPQVRRIGIGGALHDGVLEHLRECGMQSAALGGGGLSRFWAGIPQNLPEGLLFFKSKGWQFSELYFDLTCSLENYRAPAEILERMTRENIELRPALEKDIPQVLELEQCEFSGWYPEYCLKIELGDREDILVAVDGSQRVVGAQLMYSSHSHFLSVNRVWTKLLAGHLGGIGSVGVAETERGRGIGVAMVAWGSEILKERGVSTSLIDWTVLESFYGRAGYKHWRDYYYSSRKL